MSGKRDELEEAAADSVQRSGLHSLSFRTLANEVGVKSSSVHYYFPEKSHLAGALIDKYTENFMAQLDSIDQLNLDAPKKVKAFIKIFEDVLKEDRLCLCGMMAAEVASLDEENRKRLVRFFKLAEDWLGSVFSSHPLSVSNSISPKLLARTAMSGLEGAILIDRVRGGKSAVRAQRDLILGFLH